MVEGEISFGRFRLNIARRELRRDETLVRLGGRARDILCVLREADVSGSSLAPRRPVVTEGIRTVKSGRAPLRAVRQRRVYAALLGLPARHRTGAGFTLSGQPENIMRHEPWSQRESAAAAIRPERVGRRRSIDNRR